MTTPRIALLGDRSDDVIAHNAIPKALQLAALSLAIEFSADWVHTSDIDLKKIATYNGIWVVPNSPYADPAKVIAAIQYARVHHTPFIGTCGGYQHAVLEYAQNVLGHKDAGHVEDTPHTSMPLINAMFCSLREKPGQIKITQPSKMYSIVNSKLIEEQYNCGFGVNKEYLSIFNNTELSFTGFDADNDPRIIELANHPFFIGTAFQPERSALADQTHPLIIEFLQTAASASETT